MMEPENNQIQQGQEIYASEPQQATPIEEAYPVNEQGEVQYPAPPPAPASLFAYW